MADEERNAEKIALLGPTGENELSPGGAGPDMGERGEKRRRRAEGMREGEDAAGGEREIWGWATTWAVALMG